MIPDDDKKTPDDRSRDLSPGKLLTWARERAGLTQEQVAKELYMTLTKVKSLESDDYRYMGSDTFVRGYLRGYANLVHLDVPQVLAAYDRYLQKTGVVQAPPVRRAETNNHSVWRFALGILAVLLVIWLISGWFFEKRQPPVIDRPVNLTPQLDVRYSSSAANSSTLSVITAIGSADELLASNNSESVNSAVASSNATTNSAEAYSSASAISSVESLSSTPTLSLLSLSFSAECWLEVSDARGDVLAADLQTAGSRLELKGYAPFDVKLGNAPAAKVLLNGQSIDLPSLTGTNVLSLRVGE